MKKAVRWILVIFLALFAVDLLWPDADFLAAETINPEAMEHLHLLADGRFPELFHSESVWFQTRLTPTEQHEIIALLKKAKSKRKTTTWRILSTPILRHASITPAFGEFWIFPMNDGTPKATGINISREGRLFGGYFPNREDQEKMQALLTSIVQRISAEPHLLSKGEASWK